MVGDVIRRPDRRKATASTGPNCRIRTAWRLRALFVIADDRRRPCDALVVAPARKLPIPFVAYVIKIRRWPRACHAICNFGK